MACDSEPPSFWNTVNIEQNILRIPLDNDSTAHLDNDWLTHIELDERSRSNFRQTQIRKSFKPYQTLQESFQESSLDPLDESLDQVPSIPEPIPPSIPDFISYTPHPLVPCSSTRSNK